MYNIWILVDDIVFEKFVIFVGWVNCEGVVVYVIFGMVEE